MIVIIKYIGIALSILFLFRVVPYILRRINISNTTRKQINMLSPVVEFVLWSLLAYNVISHFFSEKSYFTAVIISFIILALLVFSFFVLKDFVAGLVLKSEYGIVKGIYVSTKDFSGKILHTSHLNAEILTDNQEIIKVPYSKMNGEIIKIPVEGDLIKKFEFELSFPNEKSIDETKKILFNQLITNAWVISSKQPEIVFLRANENTLFFKVFLFCLSEEHARTAIQNIAQNNAQ